MNLDELKSKVKKLINQSFEGQEIESPKVDFKTKWYDLRKNSIELYEFLKDTSSIANTFGLDGFIIIGFDEKSKSYNNSKFTDCGLRDTSDLYPLIIRRVSEPFDITVYDIVIDRKNLSIIHIPNSINKPHVIKNYKKEKKGKIIQETDNKIFVRKGTGIFSANKYDLDLMYYDKKNNIPEYEVRIDAINNILKNGSGDSSGSIYYSLHFSIENLGRRPIAISDIKIIIDEFELLFILTRNLEITLKLENEKSKSAIINPNNIKFYTYFHFKAQGNIGNPSKKQSLLKSDKAMRLTLTNGKIINAKIEETLPNKS